MVLHEFAEIVPNVVLVVGNDGGVPNWNAHGVTEQCNDRKPVGNRSDHGGFGKGDNKAQRGVNGTLAEGHDIKDCHAKQKAKGGTLHQLQAQALMCIPCAIELFDELIFSAHSHSQSYWSIVQRSAKAEWSKPSATPRANLALSSIPSSPSTITVHTTAYGKKHTSSDCRTDLAPRHLSYFNAAL